MSHVLDTSAALALLLNEPGAERVKTLLRDPANVVGISALTLFEIDTAVFHRTGSQTAADAAVVHIRQAVAEVVLVTEAIVDLARELRRRATAWEKTLYKGLREGPRRWRRSHPFEGFFLDLYCDAARLAVECDGTKHDPGYDAWRDAKVAAAGVLTLRFTNVEIGANPQEGLAKIRAVEAERAERFRNP